MSVDLWRVEWRMVVDAGSGLEMELAAVQLGGGASLPVAVEDALSYARGVLAHDAARGHAGRCFTVEKTYRVEIVVAPLAVEVEGSSTERMRWTWSNRGSGEDGLQLSIEGRIAEDWVKSHEVVMGYLSASNDGEPCNG